MATRLFALILLAMLPLGQAFSERLPFRISGIFGQADSGFSALVQNTQGQSKVYHKGDALGDGKILEINAQGMWVQIDEGKQFLGLEGAPGSKNGAALPPPAMAGTLQIPTEKVIKQLGDLYSKIDKDTKYKSIKSLNPILGLPKDAAILSINNQPVVSTKEAVESLQTALENRNWPRVELSGFTGGSQVYITPQQPQTGQ